MTHAADDQPRLPAGHEAAPQWAECLLGAGLNLDAQYLGGYTVECCLKALILHRTATPDRPGALLRISSGSGMHPADVLLGELCNLGVVLSLAIAKRMRRYAWTTDLRHESGRRDTGETVAFLKTVKAVHNWVESLLP